MGFRQLCKVAREILEADPTIDEGEWKERIKDSIKDLGYTYPEDLGTINQAMTQVRRAVERTPGRRRPTLWLGAPPSQVLVQKSRLDKGPMATPTGRPDGSPLNDAWSQVQERAPLRRWDVDKFFGGSELLEQKGNVLVVRHERWKIDWIERHFRSELDAALKTTDGSCLTVEWVATRTTVDQSVATQAEVVSVA